MEAVSAVILAAGEGTRMLSKKTKVLHEILYKPMISWVTDAAAKTGIADFCIVAGKNKDELAALITDANFVIQEEQKGTAHALMQAKDFIAARGGDVFVLYGDTPLVTSATLVALLERHHETGADMSVLGVKASNPSGYGRLVINDAGELISIVEHRDATPDQLEIDEINGGVYVFRAETLLDIFPMFTTDNAQGEYYLTDAVVHILARGGTAAAYIAPNEEEILGVNDRVQLAAAAGILKNRIAVELARSGVTLIDPASCFISPEAIIGRDTVIEPGVIIKGKTMIGEGCNIGPNTMIDECRIGDGSVVNSSQLNWSIIGKKANIGPFSYIRPGCELADNVKVGAYVELKAASVGEGTKIPHLTYAGDAVIGARVNIGCGTIFCNYDGFNKHITEIGDDVFIGSNNNLVAPVKIGRGSYTASGSTITQDVPENSLSVARSRQENKANWAKKYREMHTKSPGGTER